MHCNKPFEHIEGNFLDAIIDGEFVTREKLFDRRHEPSEKLVLGLDGPAVRVELSVIEALRSKNWSGRRPGSKT
jgi:hypothetical protein